MVGFIRVETDDGNVVDLLPEGSKVTPEESPEVLLEVVVARIRASNKSAPARPKSLAITHTEEALLWLNAFKEGTVR